MIIGIGGKFCSGKTTACDYYVNDHGFVMVNFADKLKDICADIYDMKEKDRTLLQEVGTGLRKVHKSDGTQQDAVWINYLFDKTVKNQTSKNLVIGDMRFQNEVKACKDNGAVTIYLDVPAEVRIKRFKELYGKVPTELENNHESEQLIPDGFDYVLSYDLISTLPDLYKQLSKII